MDGSERSGTRDERGMGRGADCLTPKRTKRHAEESISVCKTGLTTHGGFVLVRIVASTSAAFGSQLGSHLPSNMSG